MMHNDPYIARIHVDSETFVDETLSPHGLRRFSLELSQKRGHPL